ncbi:MAG: LemA family protein [Flavobacteriales bacterium]|nr:LemA family protein [Flavobacteriales bacterium]
MSKSTAQVLIFVFILVTLPIFFITIPVIISYYNRIKRANNNIDFSYGGMDVQLKKRADLIPNLVSSVKTIMKHETELFERITSLRSGIASAEERSAERFQMEGELSSAMGALNVSMENYPEIKSNTNMLQLQRNLTETEEQISAARRAYNSAVLNINNMITTFPGNIFGAAFDAKEGTYFQATEGDTKNPNIGNLFGV